MRLLLLTGLVLMSIIDSNGDEKLPKADKNPSNYVRQIQQWRADREQALKAPDGWLAVSGLVWLKDGDFTFGSDAAHTITLNAASSPATAGTIHVRSGNVTFKATDQAEVLLNDQPATSGVLRIDNSKPEVNSPDVLRVGHTTMHLMRRGNQLAMRLRDAEHQLIQQFPGEQWYPVDASFRVMAKFTPYEVLRSIEITNVKGQTHKGELIGVVEFELQGQQVRLVVQAESKDEIFINFRDLTSGKETYGAGRMLNAANPVDGTVELDFNKAYNPPCAYNTFTTCPLPPKENHLTIAVSAGAKKPLQN